MSCRRWLGVLALVMCLSCWGVEPLKLWIFSDTQPGRAGGWKHGKGHSSADSLDKMFQMAKKTGVDAFIGAGDISNHSNPEVYDETWNVFNYHFGNANPRPEWLVVMGNHDFWRPNWAKKDPREDSYRKKKGGVWAFRKEVFQKHMKVKSLSPHVVIKGIDIIGLSIDGGMNANAENLAYLKGELDKAVARDATKPIIVFAHTPTPGTIYGHEGHYSGEGMYNKNLDLLLRNYPQVVYLSGHTHFPLEDERLIHQKHYTSIGTGCMCYMFMEFPSLEYPKRGLPHYSLYMTIDDKEIVVRRYQMHDRTEILFEGQPWRIKLPLKKENFTYDPDVRWKNRPRQTPEFPEGSVLWAEPVLNGKGELEKVRLVGTAAKHDNFVHHYLVDIDCAGKDGTWLPCKKVRRFRGGKFVEQEGQIKFYGDFYLGLQNQQPEFKVELPVYPRKTYEYQGFAFEPRKRYRFTVHAVESYEKRSTTPLRCEMLVPGKVMASPAK